MSVYTDIDTIEEFIEYMREEMSDVSNVEVVNDGNEIWVTQNRAHGTSVGAHWSRKMFELGYMVCSTGSDKVQFERFEVEANVSLTARE